MDSDYYSKYFELLNNMPLTLQDFYRIMHDFFPQYNDVDSDTFLEILIAHSAPLCRSEAYMQQNRKVSYFIDTTTKQIPLQDCKLCFVDIESTTSNVQTGQIIEIGAIIVQNEEVIDTFDTLVYSPYVPNEIINLTGIQSYMLEDAPKLPKVLADFREFLGDCIFVAHNVSFDYNFISESLQLYDMPPLFNQRLCTLDLSRKTILSKKHALSYLNDLLGINTQTIHRAFADALTSFELYKICALSLPNEIQTIQNLIDFSKGKITYPLCATSKRRLSKKLTKYSLRLE